MKKLDSKRDYEVGMVCAILCALLWGALPIYWKSLQPIDSFLIMFYRLALSCVVLFIPGLFIYKWEGIIKPLKKKGSMKYFVLAGLIISTNWGLYIAMVNSGRIVQTSIGYYVEPLIVCIFGIIFFNEKLNRFKLIAILLAAIGVSIMILSYGQLPFLALTLAVTFGVYAAIKKKLQAPALLSLFYETVFLFPFVVAIILYIELTGRGAFATAEPYKIGLLFLSGFFTALPLTLFALAANRISLIALGITEYLSPTMGLIIGIFLYNEPFDIYQFIGFIFIWIGLSVFTAGGIIERRRELTEAKGNVNDTE
ncbi:MAG: EamA family transporter RarD [Clostridiales bacterium]|nr:EamA family transporter RarD [Clostridiales bacterium]